MLATYQDLSRLHPDANLLLVLSRGHVRKDFGLERRIVEERDLVKLVVMKSLPLLL